MTLTRPAYEVVVENRSTGWTQTMAHREVPDPDADVLLGDDLRYSWGFVNDLAPGPREADTHVMRLSCKSADVVPAINDGDVMKITCRRPLATPGTYRKYYAIGGRASDISVTWNGRRLIVVFTVTEHLADLSGTFNLADHSADITAELAAGKNNADAFGLSVVPAESTVAYAERYWHEGAVNVAKVPLRRVADDLVVKEALDAATTMQSRAQFAAVLVPTTIADMDEWPFGDQPTEVRHPAGGSASHGIAYMAEWRYWTSVAAAPWRLAETSPGVIGVENVPGRELHDNPWPGAILIDAGLCEASPTWSRDRERSVNNWKLNTWLDASATDTRTSYRFHRTWVTSRYGRVQRDFDSLGIKAPGAAPQDASNLFQNYVRSGNVETGGQWTPSTIVVKTHLMTDEQLDEYADRFCDRALLSPVLSVFNIQDEQNMAGTVLQCMITGVDLTIRDGRLAITCRVRPYLFRVFFSDDLITWGDLDTHWPDTTWADDTDEHIDPELTWAELNYVEQT